jgi:hypothetical protein
VPELPGPVVGEDDKEVMVSVETIVEPSVVNVVVVIAVPMPSVNVLVSPPCEPVIVEIPEFRVRDAWDAVDRLEMDDIEYSDHQYSSVRLEYSPGSIVTILYPILQGFQKRINTRLRRWLRDCGEFPRIPRILND